MDQQAFQLDDVHLNPGVVRRENYQGIHSGKLLSSFEIKITTATPDQSEKIDKLLAKRRVLISDPVQQRSFEASMTLESSSYQQGRPERRYVINAKEIDEPPAVEVLEISGEQFTVSEYKETEQEDRKIGRHAVLRLQEQDLPRLRRLIDADAVAVKRVGVDEQPLTLRLGGMLHWSKHEENGESVYKHIVRFFPVDLKSEEPIVFASAVVQNNTAVLALQAAAKLNDLIAELSRTGTLTEEVASRLRIDPTTSRGGDRSFLSEWQWRLEQVTDASTYL